MIFTKVGEDTRKFESMKDVEDINLQVPSSSDLVSPVASQSQHLSSLRPPPPLPLPQVQHGSEKDSSN